MRCDSIDVYVGSRLKARRILMGISQNKIGEFTGITFQQIQKYEKGVNRIGPSKLYQFAKVLGVPTGYFFDGYGESTSNVFSREEEIDNKEIMTLVKYFSRIRNQNHRQGIIQMVKSLVNKEEKEEELK